ncbi:GNAT family N-acetyltransferase [Psychromicrobium xiongbiense]|uniref:GNAT family N-acetyltransferase n=1 Tax=Psychromicrobium xiongbiense TaxID=3051184 RepID=UPI002556E1C1|nr:GNAT family N-acetyltransferase [Psychromicrobium sp. YIM S02556]
MASSLAYARLLTDGVTFGWLCDVYIAREARGLRLGTELSRVIVDAVRPWNLKRLMLVTADAHEVYEKAGFTVFPDPNMLMMLERLRAAARPLPHEALTAHRPELVSLGGRYGISNIRVFGSVAHGTDHPGSDLDVLVTRSPGTGLLTVAAFAAAASELLGVEVDVVTDGGLCADHEVLATAVAV